MLYDVTPLISTRLAVWPGDSPARRQIILDMTRGDNFTLSTLHATVHLGAHADAPCHYTSNGPAIHERKLDYYLGRCQVVRVPVTPGSLVTASALQPPITAPRVLLATGTYPDPEHFNEDFAALSPDLVQWLHERGVITVGVDTPSVDPFPSKDLPAHQMFHKHDMAILEGLKLFGVPEGVYELIALPLKLDGFDASPVRAVLRTLPESGRESGQDG